MERGDIAIARYTFLELAKEIENWDNVVFIDETWLNANHTVTKMWTDRWEGKGERLIICHAGNSKGFIPNCLLALKSKKTNEYHEEMNSEKFEGWFMTLIENLKEPSIIIMDNAKYHSRQVNKPPTSQDNKATIVEWLNNNNVPADMTMLKEKLLILLREHKPPTPTYYLDEMAKAHGHRVLRLPPYHCQYNAIKLIWAQVKGFAAKNNTSPPLTANKMLTLLQTACHHVTGENWAKVVEKTKNTIVEDWERYVRIDRWKNQLIINVGESDTASDSDSDFSDSELKKILFKFCFILPNNHCVKHTFNKMHL
ncbi:uncharacterized protein LOC106141468 [Amyelois transitella]|uniref:uncharacterized protein LOC106141468 n=1 Tax=Amyelois transitella TaxID=680683 RepID=UPI00299068A6|nr:uncharacterized protein LOC106141468 [Amyelois transitella]